MISRIGIFDSGLGGFTVLKSLLERHGDVPCLYLGDTARVPYGEKSVSDIRLIAGEIVRWLCNQDVSAILVACNTTNSLAFETVQTLSGLPVIGLIKAAAEMISESRVGVLATPATAFSHAYRDQIVSLRPGTAVFEQSCPSFVPMIEAGDLSNISIRHAAVEYLRPLLEAGVEAVILGCSHYPLIQTLLEELIPNNVRLVDPAIGLAKQVDLLLGKPHKPINRPISISNTRFCVTSDPCGFATRATHWLGKRPEVELVSLLSETCLF